MAKKIVNIRLPENMIEEITQKGTTMTNFIEKACKNELNKDKQKPSMELILKE